jgi:hypothetical protein
MILVTVALQLCESKTPLKGIVLFRGSLEEL